MSRLQKKCVITAAGFHLLLLIILIVGPGFLASHSTPDDLPVLDFVPSTLIDAKFSGGGTPNATPPPTTPPTPVPPAPKQQETPPPPAPQPQPQKTFIEKIFEPTPPKPDPDAVEPIPLKRVTHKIPDDSADETQSHKTKAEPIKLVKVKIKAKVPNTSESDSDAEAQAEAKAQAAAAKAAQARAAAFSSAMRSLKSGLSSSTTVAIPGPGGAAYANYGQVVKSIYTQAWNTPSDASNENANVKVKVVIARDGSVVSAHVVTPSGDASVDRSVAETLRRVKFIAPFPEGATDDERSFIINFNLKAKQLLG